MDENRYQDREEKYLRDQLKRNITDMNRWGMYDGENNPGAKKKYFNCKEAGHSHIGCTNPPFCHKAGHCLDKIELLTCGFGIHGMGFYSIHIPEEGNMRGDDNRGMLTVLEGSTDEITIQAEMRYFFKGYEQWQIEKISEKEFLIVFPTTELRSQLTKFKSFELQKGTESGVKVKIEATNRPTEATQMLEKVWVKAYNFPRKLEKKRL